MHSGVWYKRTQMTLNSIDWEEKIFIMENKVLKIIEIGKYIDDMINREEEDVTYLGNKKDEEKGDVMYVDVTYKDIYTISVNKDGKVRWKKVEALTKHLPMNTDGTNDLVKITTRLGRTATATKAKSFLTRVNNKIVPIRGDELKIGTRIPLMVQFPDLPCDEITYLDMSKYFSKREYIFGSEIEKARQCYVEAYQYGGIKKPWFTCNLGKKFTVPYSRGDSLKKVLDGGVQQVYKPGCVYPKKGKYMVAEIPDKLPLNREWGFFVGAYLAEGLSIGIYTCISNNDEAYMKCITDLMDKYNIGYHIVVQKNKIQKGWTSTDIRIHSVILAKFMKMVFKTGSDKKIIPDWVYMAPIEFIEGLLDGYYSGDGSVSKTSIMCSSVSEQMIDGLVLLLSKFNIICKKNKPTKIVKNNRSSKNIKQHYTISIRNDNMKRFHNNIRLTVDYKQVRLTELSNKTYNYGNGMYDIIPGNKFEGYIGDIHRNKIMDLINNGTGYVDYNRQHKNIRITQTEKKYLKKIIKSDVYHDSIVSIELIKPTHKYVYDLTVKDDLTFCSSTGVLFEDTFHHAGIGAAGTATLGVPRIREILHCTKNMKTPIMTIYLKKEYRQNEDIATKIASSIKNITLGDIKNKIKVYYNPDPKKGRKFMEKDNVYNIFHSYNPGKHSCQNNINNLPWLARVILDKEKMLEKDITLMDIKVMFCKEWGKRHGNLRGMKRNKKKIIEKITHCAIISNNENDKEPIIHIRFDMTDYNYNTIVNFVDMFIDNFKLKGLVGVTNADTYESLYIDYDNDNQKFTKSNQQVIYTAGINMTGIRYINGIDLNRTLCNDVRDVYNKFGIDAARTLLLKELDTVFKESNINYQHLYILVDLMTHTGGLTSIDRHGLNVLDKDPLARASFEKPVEQLLNAAVFSEVDYMNSVSSRIMAGLVVRGGTGLCETALDIDMLEQSEYSLEEEEAVYTKTFSDLTTNNIMTDILNKKDVDAFIPV